MPEPTAKQAPGPEWTEAQLRGIRTTGHSILVSAAAGSGKTAMLAERCAYLVCEAPERCDVDSLLVVTFTEAAASEMKSRIHAALRERADASDSERLRRQLALINHASVSTLHSFCARLLREHFHLVGLDPAFTVLDGEEAGLLRREIARELFDDRYELDGSGDFHRFVDAYGEGDDARLTRKVIDTHEMLGSLVHPQAWVDRSRHRITEAAQVLETSELGVELTELLSRGITDITSRCDRAMELIPRLGRFPAYLEALTECAQILRHWNKTLAGDGIDALAEEMRSLELPRLKAVSNSIAGKELAKEAVDSVREAMTRGAWRDLLRFTSAQWQDGLRAIQPHAEVFLGLVEEFGRRYRLAKDASRVVDFADLERFALEVLADRNGDQLAPSAAARAYHKRFAHVLVDEYQDINEVQDAILALLSRECVSDEPGQTGNLFSVGDVKQSIYRFRLAEAARFLERQKLFRRSGDQRRGEVIDLQSNFRSRAPLLDAINAIFERLMTAEAADIEYDQTHRLQPGLKYPPSDGSPCFSGAPIEMHLLPGNLVSEEEDPAPEPSDELELDRSEREAVLVAQRIRQMMGLEGAPAMQVMEKDGSGSLRPRPVRFGDIMILLRSMRYKSEQYADILRRASIPVHAQSGTGYFEMMEVRDILSLLSVLENQRQDIPLAAVLRSPLANLAEPETCLARIRLAFPAEGDEAVAFHDAVVRYAQEKDDELAAGLRDFLAQLDQWRHLAHSRAPAELIWTVYQQSGFLAFCSGLHDGEQRVANLMDLHERAGQFGSFRTQGLWRFMQFLESLRDEADLGQPSTASEADDVVRVMSIHRSKGLEFPVVILPDLGKRINLSDCQGAILTDRTAGLGMSVVDEHKMVRYPSLASVLVQRRLRQQALAEELRVLYVAMTRAKEHLILVGTCKPELCESWRNRWADHAGAFPPEMVLGARCILDWLGPAAAASTGGAGEIIRIALHPAEEVASWQSAHSKRPILTAKQTELAQLKPLAEPPPAAAGEVIDRLQFRYPFDDFTRLAAADAVTRREGHDAAATREPAARELRNPTFLAAQAPSPADIGTATHRVLLHLDFRHTCDAKNVEDQITAMVERGILRAEQSRMIDRGAIQWLLNSKIGALLKANPAALRRELSIHFAAADEGLSESADPQDRVMIRGRIDLLVPSPQGAALIDYKTDSIEAHAVPNRAQAYVPQIRQYQQAVERITGNAVSNVHLVFLTPRVIWTMSGEPARENEQGHRPR